MASKKVRRITGAPTYNDTRYRISYPGGIAIKTEKDLGKVATQIQEIAGQGASCSLFVRNTWTNAVLEVQVMAPDNVEVRNQPDAVWVTDLYTELKKRGVIATVPKGDARK